MLVKISFSSNIVDSVALISHTLLDFEWLVRAKWHWQADGVSNVEQFSTESNLKCHRIESCILRMVLYWGCWGLWGLNSRGFLSKIDCQHTKKNKKKKAFGEHMPLAVWSFVLKHVLYPEGLFNSTGKSTNFLSSSSQCGNSKAVLVIAFNHFL